MQKNARISELSRQGGPPRARYAWLICKAFFGQRKMDKQFFLDAEVWKYGICGCWREENVYISLVFPVRIFNCLQMMWVLETLSQYPARFLSTESALETLEAQNRPNSSWMNWRTHSKSFNTRNKTVKRFWNVFWTCSIICTMISV